jgi:hypothetical protein
LQLLIIPAPALAKLGEMLPESWRENGHLRVISAVFLELQTARSMSITLAFNKLSRF